MGRRVVVESGRDRRALVADAGWSRLSLVSILAGVLVAYGAFAVLTGIAGGVLQATGADTDITAGWPNLGVAAGLVVAGLLLLSYLFGGYVAGRMARRAGVAHGLGVFVLGVLVVAVVAVVVRQAAGTEAVVNRLRDLGLPTTGSEWGHVGTVAGLASLAAVLVGAVLGGVLGERWHAKLLARALDPDVGAEAEARRQAELAAAQAQVHRRESEVHRTEVQDRVDAASLRRLRDTDEADATGATPQTPPPPAAEPEPPLTAGPGLRRESPVHEAEPGADDAAGPPLSRPSRRGTSGRRA
jgi:hypothetical protein